MDTTAMLVIAIVAVILALWLGSPAPPLPQAPSPNMSPPAPTTTTYTGQNLTVAAWNLQVWGPSKASQSGLVARVLQTLQDYDIVFVQEIRDESDTHDAFAALCSNMTGYKCGLSSRAGRTQVKEQYGLLYRDTLVLSEWADYNPDPADRWERPPIKTKWHFNNYDLTIYTLHAKPTAVAAELHNLENMINNTGNVIVIGDLNAACLYYTPDQDSSFDTWFWAIRDDQRTNLAAEGCAYDRILLNADAAQEYVAATVTTTSLNSTVSDHYPVSVTLRPTETLT